MPKYRVRLVQRLVFEGTIDVVNETIAKEFAETLARTSGGRELGYDPTLIDDEMQVLAVEEVP